MLISAREERARRFKLALRAGIPIIVLITLLFYTTFSMGGFVSVTIENALLMGGLIFITVYFIYFLLELDVQETLLDQTTDGFNQLAFIKRLKQDKPKTVAILLINNLSTINENYGTVATNQLLNTFVSKLNKDIYAHQIKESILGRNSGAEFLIALDADSSFVQLLLEEFIEENQTIDTIELDYRFAIVSHNETDPERTISQLKDELASNELKRSDQQHTIRDAADLSHLEKSITTALKQKSLSFCYRPLYNIKSDKIDTYEISVKLLDDNGKEILPRDFLPIINRLGLGRNYDAAIFKHIVEIARLTDEDISFAFNLSPFSLRDRDFLDNIFALLDDVEIDTNRLIIELYERKTHHNLSKYLKTLSKIRRRGIRICIDNFGSTSASLEYMKYFKFDIIQFDRDFVVKLDKPNSLSILKSLIDMSKEMKVTTVAKWVDTDDQKKKLESLGIDYLQGFGIGKELTERDLIQRYN